MASDIFAKIGDIKGESARRQAQGRNRGAVVLLGRHKFREHRDRRWWRRRQGDLPGSCPSFTTSTRRLRVLLKACATGAHLKEATITHRKAGKGQQEYLIVKMNDVIITGVVHRRHQRRGGIGDRESGVCQGRLRVQAAEGRRLARCGDSFQVRHQGQQGRLAAFERRSRAGR